METERLIRLGIVAILTAGAILINPVGFRMLLYPYINLSDSISMSVIGEWSSPDAKDASAVIMGFLPIAVMLFGMISTEKRVRMIDAVLLALFTLLYLRSVRFLMLWYIAAAFCAFEYLPETRIKPVDKKGELAVVYVAIALSAAFMCFGIFKIIKRATENDIISKAMSNTAVEVIKEDAPERLYNDYNLGETLIYNDIKVFFDARADLFAQENIMKDGASLAMLFDIGSGTYSGFDPEALIEKYGFDAIVILKSRPLYAYLASHPEKYMLEYSDEDLGYFKVSR